ncbi:LysR family transcriptional regulator, regulator for metE and metH [Chitinophaga terrae (ex Kim and Jung 2007)]|uniref:LysR family transcriptional regulator, regulator for metE and metH n=1 Tax=Chitinophaga terrae (ex Kim and Jung 2007) TaxID=408074 RepID=A0A1H4GA59_9BACT|nr:LysR family transcriptional regulator [Chitinophaga terrae (ex Kim and Jung 2007)]MDQ0109050.1 LysR family transcriptional regulator for metE and metH [Chitinophaga terrae (ex Kim and Jung 2007)]GEP93172.1 transcriptional regulator [Chitinophaga terrae (ex Kim and Jung 2007)]SEB06161.1 LysR family transcriptional regulator, regulator for metE and metH [Chitinophaga terrae (ex Kim and Jung 2007)]
MITLQHLQIVKRIISEGSVTRASQKLNLTQSALSHQIRDLEGLLGLQLFHRSGKKMILTEAGRKVLEQAETVLPMMEELHSDLQLLKEGRKQTIRLSTECYTCYHWLPAILHTFRQQYPEVMVEIVVQATQRPMKSLEEGQLDLAIVSKRQTDDRFRYETLFDDELVAVISKEHPLAELKKIKSDHIAGQTVLVYNFGNNTGSVLENYLKLTPPKKLMAVPLTEAIIEMVKANIGITVMARWAAQPYLNNQLKVIPLDSPLRKRRWYACMHKEANEPLKQLASLIRQRLKA